MMRLEIIDSISGFEKLRGEWESLLLESGSDNIFLTFEWQYLYWKHFGDTRPLFILVVFDGKKAAAIFPLMINKRSGFRELRFIGYPVSDYEDIIITGDQAKREEAIDAALGLLSDTPKWDILRLKGIREGPLLYSSLCRRQGMNMPLGFSLQQHCDGAPQILLECGWESYYSGLRKSFVSDIRAFRKRVGEEAEYIPADAVNEKDLPALLDEFMALYTKRRQEAGGESFFEDKRMREFFCAVSREFFEKKVLKLSQYRIKGEIAAMEAGFSYNGRFFRYLAAFDGQFKKCSVARLLLFEVIKYAFDKGLNVFDFMLGEEPYKRFWNPLPQRLSFYTLHRKTLRGYAAYLVFNKMNLICKKITGRKW